MSKLFDYLYQNPVGLLILESDLRQIRSIVLEEAGLKCAYVLNV